MQVTLKTFYEVRSRYWEVSSRRQVSDLDCLEDAKDAYFNHNAERVDLELPDGTRWSYSGGMFKLMGL